jgi:hypothetical protein
MEKYFLIKLLSDRRKAELANGGIKLPNANMIAHELHIRLERDLNEAKSCLQPRVCSELTEL